MAQQESPTRPPQRRSRVAATFRALMRTRITAGLLVVLPLYVTALLIKVVFRTMRDSSLWAVEAYLRSPLGEGLLDKWQVVKPTGYATWPDAPEATTNPSVLKIPVTDKLDFLEFRLGHPPEMDDFFNMLPETVQWITAIVAVLLTIIILYAIGLFAANLVGRRVINMFENALDKVPLVKTVYRSTKQILATFAGEQSEEFQRAALVPFPQERMRCVGFITAIFNDSITGEELATVFIPTTPNPTTGYLQILKRKDLVELDWSVEDAVRTIMSGGILRPDFVTLVPTAKQESLPEIRQPELQPPPDKPA